MIALVAGEGKMPALIFEEAKKRGLDILLLALRGLASPELIAVAEHVKLLDVPQIGKALATCKRYGVKELIMAGRVAHTTIFNLRFDWRAVGLLWRVKDRRADTLLKELCALFAREGITVLHSTVFLERYCPKQGILSKAQPSQELWEEIQFGAALAREVGRLDIGQTVVVKRRAVVAVEAMEGTDLCLERAFKVAGKGCTVVKMAKPEQDMRFDVPVIGKATMGRLIQGGARALAVEAEKTVIVDEEVLKLADQHRIVVVAL